MMPINDEMLAAYVDGELSDADRELVERALAEDAKLARRVAQQRALRSRLGGTYDQVLRESVPERLLQAARVAAPAGPAQIISLARARAERARRDRVDRSRVLSRRAAIAASLLIGVCIGLLIQRLYSSGGLMELRAGTLLARGGLSDALSHQLSGADGRSVVRIGLTFRAKDGTYCRTFTVSSGHAEAGLACREQQQWQLVTLLEDGGSAGNVQSMRLAGSSMPPALLQAVTARISGEPLDALDEAHARDIGWR